MLSHRGRRILFALVSEFLEGGDAVSSLQLVKNAGLDLSAASIRAVFAELDGLGYLTKSHASAGRVPTEKGLRAFVDALIGTSELPNELRCTLEAHYSTVGPGVENALRHTGRVLAEVTHAAAVVIASPSSGWKLQDLRFISLRACELLAVIVGRDGGVQNRVLRTETPISPADLERVNNVIAPLLDGRTLPEVRALLAQQLESERARIDTRLSLALSLGARALAQVDGGDAGIVVEGAAELIGRPEFSDIDRARAALRTLEDRERLLALLDRTLAAPGIQVLIGSEDAATGASELSVVAAPVGGAVIGVIGSTRMDYPSVVPAVRYTATLLERLLREPSDEGGPAGEQ